VTFLLVTLGAAALIAVVAFVAWPQRGRRRTVTAGSNKRVLVPFTGGALEPRVLAAAIRIARAEGATLVPAYLLVVPLELPADAAVQPQVAVAMPLLEAVENASLRAGVPVDARVESGRTPIHALQRLWEVEHFDRIVAPAPAERSRGPGFTPKDLTWMLLHAPSELVILRPDPAG
jgi:hypothetical protein